MSDRLKRVFNLDTHESLYFVKDTPYQAMEALIYTLNLKHFDPNVKILPSVSGRTLSVVHNGQTWSILNR